MFAIKAEINDSQAAAFTFSEQKTMYGGKLIGEGDPIFLFASENDDGSGLVAHGIVTSVEAKPTKPTFCPANAASEHHHQGHRTRKAHRGTKRTQTLFSME